MVIGFFVPIIQFLAAFIAIPVLGNLLRHLQLRASRTGRVLVGVSGLAVALIALLEAKPQAPYLWQLWAAALFAASGAALWASILGPPGANPFRRLAGRQEGESPEPPTEARRGLAKPEFYDIPDIRFPQPSVDAQDNFITDVRPNAGLRRFVDIGGMETLKEDLKGAVGRTLSHHEAAGQLAVSAGSNLLHGPPGHGQPTMAGATDGG